MTRSGPILPPPPGRRVNPAPDAAAIAFFLLVALLASGVVLFIYYSAEFSTAYASVERLNRETWLGWIARGTHRHAAELLILAVLLHSLRSLVRGRARGARRWPWISGVALFFVLAAQGMTGSVLPWDERSQAIMETLAGSLSGLGLFGEPLGRAFLVNEEVSARAMIYLLAAHLAPSFLILALLGAHFYRLRRPRIWPSRPLVIALLSALFASAVLVPAGSLGPADFTRIPGRVPFDWLSLFPLPLMSGAPPGLFWGGVALFFAAAALVPAALGAALKSEVVEIDERKCVGCGLCVEDCPYSAMELLPVPPEEKHPWAARVSGGLCVGCAVCVGSCGFGALDIPSRPAPGIRAQARGFLSRREGPASPVVVYACENAMSRARGVGAFGHPGAFVIPVRCAGQVYPGWVEENLENGAARVAIVRCAPESCRGREGADFAEKRIYHKRKPWLKKRIDRGRVGVVTHGGGAGAARLWGGAALAAVFFVFLIFSLDRLWKAAPYSLDDPSMARVTVSLSAAAPSRLAVLRGGREVFVKYFDDGNVKIFERVYFEPGKGGVTVRLVPGGGGGALAGTLPGPVRRGEALAAVEDPRTGGLRMIR
ncbi:MAG: cytochrome b N-terminal domain-containing protein [Candidatus Nitrospinota bacterium M3_3B_026]